MGSTQFNAKSAKILKKSLRVFASKPFASFALKSFFA